MKDARALSADANNEPITALLDRLKIAAAYRPGTSDERVLREVLTTTPYHRRRIHFDVEKDEMWLDLGANIGAFGIYCRMRGAYVECYEPDSDCFAVLTENGQLHGFNAHRYAVTTSMNAYLPFWVSKGEGDHHRGTVLEKKKYPLAGQVPNLHIAALPRLAYDGIKMDIEGSEAEILDAGHLPECKKLVLEYHLWRDPSMENLRRRLDFLHSKFSVVSYPPEFDRMLASPFKENTSYYDRLIFCMK
jgi:FkbM family methyltransferase